MGANITKNISCCNCFEGDKRITELETNLETFSPRPVDIKQLQHGSGRSFNR